MPQLAETMYCSEQICIPPTFPYLLRQFAKAAIRTQPNDLLRWSTAYFKCLSLNIPPPVKPRLEYPIPRNYFGITPGWLKALLRQLENNSTVSFKVLWDRWIGACLQHETLIQILCLGGFTDPFAVPWLQFVALCAAHLTENLTSSMILICEILTDEPEGGSSMINGENFLQLYTFLAAIDASKPQMLKNRYFLDSLLDLWKDRVEKLEKIESKKESSEESESTKTPEEVVEEMKEIKVDTGEVVSCPSLVSEPYEPLLENIGTESSGSTTLTDNKSEKLSSGQLEDIGQNIIEYVQEMGGSEEGASVKLAKGASDDASEKVSLMEVQPYDSVDTVIGGSNTEVVQEEEERVLKEDLEKLKKYQAEAGETDEELEKFKCKLIEDMPTTKSMESAVGHFEKIEDSSEKELDAEKSSETVESEEEEYEEVYVDAIPGIGPIVPADYVEAVYKYVREMSSLQHEMFMPRNIRHFKCPPLEVGIDDSNQSTNTN